MIGLPELETIVLAALVIVAGGFLSAAGQEAFNWLRDELKRRKRS